MTGRMGRARAAALAGLVGLVVGMVVGLISVVAGVAPGGIAHAHNSIVSSDPADGAVLDQAPTQMSFVFDQSVPLDSATVTLIDASGVRTELPIGHGPSGETEVVASLAGLTVAGDVTVRWRLVGDDGHVVSGRVNMSVPAGGGGAGGGGAGGAATTVPGAGGTVDLTGGTDGTGGAGGVDGAADDGEPSNGLLAWLVRFGSYLAIAAVVAVALLEVRVWPGVAATATGRRVVQIGLAAVGVLGLAHLVVLASDLSGRSVLASFGELGPALDTSVGQALFVRVMLAGVAAVVLLGGWAGARASQGQWTALAMLGVAMMGTWAWTGHSRTERWPWLGVPVDIVHHSAAALWVGGLAVLAWVALRGPGAGVGSVAGGGVAGGGVAAGGLDVVGVMRRFSTTAMVAVIVIAVTGVVQTVRLHDDLGALTSGQHGRLLGVKVAAFVGMLAVAAGNRQRVARLVGDGGGRRDAAGLGGAADDGGDALTLAALRRSMLIDVVVGIAVIGVTASLVTSTL